MTLDPKPGPPVDSSRPVPPCVQRRAVLRGGLAVGALGLTGVLGACGGSDDAAQPAANSGAGGGSGGGSGGGGGGGGAGGSLGAASEVPVGGGKVFSDQKVVVTQPKAGDFKAFTAICTHEQCVVAEVEKGTINCRCHLSMFSIEDGSVKGGPAPAPLAPKQVTVSGGQITLA